MGGAGAVGRAGTVGKAGTVGRVGTVAARLKGTVSGRADERHVTLKGFGSTECDYVSCGGKERGTRST